MKDLVKILRNDINVKMNYGFSFLTEFLLKWFIHVWLINLKQLLR